MKKAEDKKGKKKKKGNRRYATDCSFYFSREYSRSIKPNFRFIYKKNDIERI